MIMKKYLFLITIIISMLYHAFTFVCPQEFSSEDKRPFFEQYETEINTDTIKEN